MNIREILKNTANVFKTFAVRFFDLYFIIYAILAVLQYVANNNYIFVIVMGLIFLSLNCFLKYKLNINSFFRNVGFKYGVCVLVLFTTYVILCIMGNKDIVNSVIFILSVVTLIGLYDTNLNLISYLKSCFSNQTTVEPFYVVKEKDIKINLTSICTSYTRWDTDDLNNDSVAEMLDEFLRISNENQMGHIVVRSMTSCDENGTERLCVKAKDGYHIIVRGDYEHLVDMCSEVICDGKLLSLKSEDKDKLNENITNCINSSAKVVCCAFKEVCDITADENNDFIFAGYGIYDYDMDSIKADAIVEVYNEEHLSKVSGANVKLYKNTIAETVSILHDEGKYVCGKYTECDGENPPVNKNINIKVVDSFKKIISFAYTLLISVLLLSSNLLISLFDNDVFNYTEIAVCGVLIFIFVSILVFCGDIKSENNLSLYISSIISTIAVIISYFFGRYLMENGEYSNDLFYEVTAGAMATVTWIICTVLSLNITIKFSNRKAVMCSCLAALCIIIYLLLPYSCKVFEGYKISTIYITTGIFIATCSTGILGVIIILRSIIKRNGRKISD